MKNKIKFVVAALLICVAAIGVNGTSINYGVRVHNEGIVTEGGEKTVGRNDADYTLFEEYGSDAEIYACIEDGYFSTPVIEKILNDGYCLGYVDQLKAEGWIPQDFTPAGSKPSSTAQAETKTETPADNQTVPETKEQPKTEPKTDTKTETKAEPTQEEIDAAWEETERTEATCTEDGKIVYTNSITGDTKEESIPAAGHAEGEWTVTKEAGLFSAGEKTLACEKCGEVLKTESIQQKCPLSLTAVIGIAVCIILVAAIVIMAVAKRHKRE